MFDVNDGLATLCIKSGPWNNISAYFVMEATK